MIARKAPAEDAGGTGTQRWVMSALDCRAHLLSDLPRGGDWLRAQCGAVLPMTTYRHDHQPTGPLACAQCARIATQVPGRSPVERSLAPRDRSVPLSDPVAEVVVDIPDHSAAEPCGRPMTPGEALVKLFMENADQSRNAANDDLVMALRQRAREIQALADSCSPGTTPHPPELPDITPE